MHKVLAPTPPKAFPGCLEIWIWPWVRTKLTNITAHGKIQNGAIKISFKRFIKIIFSFDGNGNSGAWPISWAFKRKRYSVSMETGNFSDRDVTVR